MPPQPAIFLPAISQYRPMYGNVDPRQFQSMDLSSMLGGGNMGMMGNMMMQPLLTQMMGSQGLVPGQFQPSMNMFDRLQAQQFFQQQQQAMQQASQADLVQQRAQLAGFFQMVQGRPISAEQQRFIDQSTQSLQSIMPLLATMRPDMVDAWHGPPGSATVMAQNVHLGGRGLIDPITGQFGLRGGSAAALSTGIFNQLYGPGTDIAQMRGLGAGRAGQLFAEMANRGYMGSLTREEALQGVQADRGFGSRDDMVKAMGGMDSPAMQQALQTFDAKRAAGRIKEVAGAVSAMRDIFGEMGETNAPMPRLINAINALTQGGMSTMGGAQLELTVRRAANLARSSGMGMDSMMQLMGSTAQLTDQMGLARAFVPDIAMSAAAFGQAFKAVGGGGIPGWDRMDAEKMTVLARNLSAGAASSPMANMLGAAARMVSQGMTGAGSDMAKLVEAVKKGQTTFTDSGGRQVDIGQLAADPQSFLSLAEASGVSPGMAGQMLRGTRANQQYGQDASFGIQPFTRGQQGRSEIIPILTSGAAVALTPVMDRFGARAQGLTAGLSGLIARTLMAMPAADRHNPARRNALLLAAVRAHLGPDFQQLGRTDAERAAIIAQIAGATESNVGSLIADNPEALGQYTNMNNMIDMHSAQTLSHAAQADRDATFESRMQGAFAHVGQDSPVRRLAGALAAAGPGTGIGEVLGKFFGGVPNAQIIKALGPMAQQLSEEQKKLSAMASRTGIYAGMSEEQLQQQITDQTRRVRELLTGRNPEQLAALAKMRGITGDNPGQQLIYQLMAGEITDERFAGEVREAAGLEALTQAGLGQSAPGGVGRRPGETGPRTARTREEAIAMALGESGSGVGGGGRIEIDGVLTINPDGTTAHIGGLGHRRAAQSPGGR